ncbi:hypothetical protein ACF1BU_14775 [Streptomyces sp. NPDC014724]
MSTVAATTTTTTATATAPAAALGGPSGRRAPAVRTVTAIRTGR